MDLWTMDYMDNNGRNRLWTTINSISSKVHNVHYCPYRPDIYSLR